MYVMDEIVGLNNQTFRSFNDVVLHVYFTGNSIECTFMIINVK